MDAEYEEDFENAGLLDAEQAKLYATTADPHNDGFSLGASLGEDEVDRLYNLTFAHHDDGAADGDHNAAYEHHNDAEHYEAENVNYDNYYQSNHEYQHTQTSPSRY